MAMATHVFQLMQKEPARSRMASQQHRVYRRWRRSIGFVINVHRMRNACRAFVSVAMVGRATVSAVCPSVPKAMRRTRRNAFRYRPRKSVCVEIFIFGWRLKNSKNRIYCVFLFSVWLQWKWNRFVIRMDAHVQRAINCIRIMREQLVYCIGREQTDRMHNVSENVYL